MGRNRYEFKARIVDPNGKEELTMSGKWNEFLKIDNTNEEVQILK